MTKNKKLISFVQSLILLPISIAALPVSSLSVQNVDTARTTEVIFLQKQKEDIINPEEMEKIAQALAIDTYFESRGMPLAGMGGKMIEVASEHNLDWRLIPAIAVRESTGGKFACKRATYNPFGWGSCKIGFESNDHAIEIVAKNLAGKNPRTERHYAGKTIKGILQAYNPPSIVPKYAEQVISIMNAIGPETMIATLPALSEEVAVK